MDEVGQDCGGPCQPCQAVLGGVFIVDIDGDTDCAIIQGPTLSGIVPGDLFGAVLGQ